MRKMAVFSFLFLSIIVGGLLFWQWNAYSVQSERAELVEKNVKERIVIETHVNKMNVKQTFSGLIPEKQYVVHIPEQVENWTCLNKDESPCEDGDGRRAMISQEDEMSIVYDIPMIERNQSMLLMNWDASLVGVDVKSTKLEIAETIRRDGFWTAGARFIGREKFDLIDYYAFDSKQPSIPLYWEEEALVLTKINERVLIYAKDKLDEMELSTEFTGKFTSLPFMTVVMTEAHEETQAKGLLIVAPNMEQAKLEKQLAIQHFMQLSKDQYDLSLYDTLAAMFMNTAPETAKGTNMLASIEGALSEAEQEVFIQRIVNKEVPLETSNLDDLLLEIKGLKTRFFELNEGGGEAVAMYFFEPKQIIVDDKETEMEVFVVNDKRLYPFIETVEALGFNVNNLSDQVLLTKEDVMMRFYLDKNIFILNEEDYGLLEKPLKDINGDIYIEQKWLQNIFHVDFSETDTSVFLKQKK